MTVKRVAVIGAGVSGLLSIKACVEEGIEPVCFEQCDQLGGVWINDDKRVPGTETRGAIYDCLITNSSKEMMCLSDYPFDPSVPPYIRGDQLIHYYRGYAKQFDLEKWVRYNTRVVRVEPTEDFDKTGQWLVKTQKQNGDVNEEVFDAVMVCSGLHSQSSMPTFPGMDEFKGEIVHSCDFKNGQQFAGKTVVVVGGSHSAGDIAVDTSRYAKKVYLAMKTGTTIIPRQGPDGRPMDHYINRRSRGILPRFIWKKMIWNFIYGRLDMVNLGLQSDRPFLSTTSVMVNDEIGVRIWCGSVVAKPNIERFTENGVVFVDGTEVENVDVVLFATGFRFRFPFIDKSIVQENYADLELYWHVFPPRLAHNTIAVIGTTTSVGALGPVYELQARLAAQVFKGNVKLPCRERMLEDVMMRKKIYTRLYGYPKAHFVPIPYMDMLAAKIGCLPSFKKLLLTDPALAYKFFFGPNFPSIYRLVGPHAWSGAREAVMNGRRNNDLSTKSRTSILARKEQQSRLSKYFLLVVPLVFLICVNVFLKI